MKKRLISMLLMVALVFALSVSAFALNDGASKAVIGEPGEVLGGLADQDGVLLPDDAPTTHAIGQLFTLTAAKVYNLLTTYGVQGKSFTGGAMDGLTGEGLLIEGTVSTNPSSDCLIKVGACYYKASTDTFVAVVSPYFRSGYKSYAWFSKLNFSNSMTYYGAIKNNTGSDAYYISGELTFSVSTNPDK